MAMKYIRCEFPEPFLAGQWAGWGGVLLYYEMGEDLGAVRQIDIFDNGKVLFYDRNHHTDQYGGLAEGELEPLDPEYPYPLGYVDSAVFEDLWTRLEPINWIRP